MPARTAVLIPARDEAPRVGRVIERARAALPGAEVLVVDGGSEDDTADVARAAGARVVRQVGPLGYARALSTGYRELAGAGFSRVLQLDADGQHPPEAAASLLARLADANLVIGSRSARDRSRSALRRLGNRALAVGVRAACGLRVRDATSGFWAFDDRALAFFAAAFPEDVADANVRVLAHRGGLAVAEVGVTMAARGGGSSMHDGPRGVLNMGLSVFALARAAVRPL